ncbi:acyl-CoA N-acyltransferase [Infundibulicybe gibba]|nr:acyl-CoA N-acyltransferase [Infundibulicybe gibba]
MSFVNTYKPPMGSNSEPVPYDINFNHPVPTNIETDRVKLTPFIPSVHGPAFVAACRADPSVTRFLPFTIDTPIALHEFIENFIRQDPSCIVFAVLDKTAANYDTDIERSLTGMIGLFHASVRNRSAEIAPVVVLPAFQRTFVSSNSIGALLRWFRRLWWTANPANAPSQRAAERMGLKKEGVERWTWVMPVGNDGGMEAGEGRGEGPGRNSVIYSCCWDDWEGGVRELVTKQIDRI